MTTRTNNAATTQHVRPTVRGTQQQVRALGLTCMYTDGEYRINYPRTDARCHDDASAYYTDDATDAVQTARRMARVPAGVGESAAPGTNLPHASIVPNPSTTRMENAAEERQADATTDAEVHDICPSCQVAGSAPYVPRHSAEAFCTVCGSDWPSEDPETADSATDACRECRQPLDTPTAKAGGEVCFDCATATEPAKPAPWYAAFGADWDALTIADRWLLVRDYTNGQDTDPMTLHEYARRIGAGHLLAYVQTQRVRFAKADAPDADLDAAPLEGPIPVRVRDYTAEARRMGYNPPPRQLGTLHSIAEPAARPFLSPFTAAELAIIGATLTTYAREVQTAQYLAAEASGRPRTDAEIDTITTLFMLAQRAELAAKGGR